MDGYYSDDEFASEISTQLTYGTVYKLTEQAEALDGKKFDHIVFERIFCVDKDRNVVGRDHNSVIILGGNIDDKGEFIPLSKNEKLLSNINYHFNIGNIFNDSSGQLLFKRAFFFDRKRREEKERHIADVLSQDLRIQPGRALPRRVDFVEPGVNLGQGVSTRSDHDFNKYLRRSRKSSRGEGCNRDKYDILDYPLRPDDREKISIYYRNRLSSGYVPGGQPGERTVSSEGYDRSGGTKKYKHSRNSRRKIKTMKRRKKKYRKRR
jgi:hypothetical protein